MDIAAAPLHELLVTYREILRELRVRGITGDEEPPTAGFAEVLAAAHYHGTRDSRGGRWNVLGSDGQRVLVRALIPSITGGDGRQLPTIKSWDFDLLLVILFDDSYRIARATEIPVSKAEAAAMFTPRSNGYVLLVTEEFLDEARTDLTEVFSTQLGRD